MGVIRLGTRGSALARWQSDHIADRLRSLHPGLAIEVTEISSTGDQITDIPLSHVEGTGFFTSTIEQALQAGSIDIAVHSYKDLPVAPTPGLVVAAVPERAPAEDVLCGRDGLSLMQLPAGARIGTCSTRRTAQVLALRPDVECVPLRGNVPTRVARVTQGELDAVVLARAGLVRLGLSAHITEIFVVDQMLPAPAQGALAVQCRDEDGDMRALLAALEDAATRRVVEAERTLLHVLGGGCSVPVGAHARTHGARLILDAGVFASGGERSVRIVVDGTEPRTVGEAAARRLLSEGAGAILEAFDKVARIDAVATAGQPS